MGDGRDYINRSVDGYVWGGFHGGLVEAFWAHNPSTDGFTSSFANVLRCVVKHQHDNRGVKFMIQIKVMVRSQSNKFHAHRPTLCTI